MIKETATIQDPEINKLAKNLIKAAYAFWIARQRIHSSAVVWLEDDDGKLLVFTRSEYADQIKQVINENLSETFYFPPETSRT